jgi:hypothetical protein
MSCSAYDPASSSAATDSEGYALYQRRFYHRYPLADQGVAGGAYVRQRCMWLPLLAVYQNECGAMAGDLEPTHESRMSGKHFLVDNFI